MNKRAEFGVLMSNIQPDFIGVTETWCNESVTDGMLVVDGYKIFRMDRLHGHGGGVFLQIKQAYNVTLCDRLCQMNFDEAIWCIVDIGNGKSVLVGVTYRPPCSSATNNSKLLAVLREACRTRCTDILIMGDFNLPKIDFVHYCVDAGPASFENQFLNTILELNLCQHVQFHTRFCSDVEPSKLDLIFSDKSDSVV